MPATNTLRNAYLDHIFGGPNYTRLGTLYVALSTTTPVVGGTNFTEPVEVSYARVSIDNDAGGTVWTTSSGGSKSNSAIITFPQATGSWGTITYFGLYDQSTAGTLLAYGILTVAKPVSVGDTTRFAVGDLVITAT